MHGMEGITCFIMENLFGKDYMNIERIYDLKGSTQGRKSKLTSEEDQGLVKTGLKVLKDINFIDFKDSLSITKPQRIKLSSIIDRDAKFLAQNNLMDYSLLLIKARTKSN